LANTAQARKRARQNEDSRQHNASMRSMMRTSIKRVRRALESKDKAEAQVAYTAAVPLIDRMANKGIIEKNAAARYKSRMVARLKTLQ